MDKDRESSKHRDRDRESSKHRDRDRESSKHRDREGSGKGHRKERSRKDEPRLDESPSRSVTDTAAEDSSPTKEGRRTDDGRDSGEDKERCGSYLIFQPHTACDGNREANHFSCGPNSVFAV
jgi:hypothetical protein